jgi:hypothetical protein
MARQIVVSWNGASSSFDIGRLSREKLYGRKRRLVVDEDGNECLAGMLTEDGSTLLPPGSTSELYLDEEFDVVERSSLRAVDEEGEEVPSLPSTLGVEVTLEEVPPERLLDHVTPVVYQLDPAELDDALREALAAGSVFETRFNYRTSYADQACFLVANDAGFFALVGQPAGFAFLEPDAAPAAAPTAEDDPFADDFDFGML